MLLLQLALPVLFSLGKSSVASIWHAQECLKSIRVDVRLDAEARCGRPAVHFDTFGTACAPCSSHISAGCVAPAVSPHMQHKRDTMMSSSSSLLQSFEHSMHAPQSMTN